jgi:hypothetical protein
VKFPVDITAAPEIGPSDTFLTSGLGKPDRRRPMAKGGSNVLDLVGGEPRG